ncbi:MAG: bifunctional diaminohydroxyphosphoribosylaminopyrimidine deaminase/5-amino-6-(5-phosphoribosylamino)uracil reductase RibD [Candidatus Kapaibacteriales bacterium]
MKEKQWMMRALELAKLGGNRVHPNPRVGAVIVKNDEIVAEGYHKYFGGNHAEIEAINSAKGIELEGATLVVTLEPCVHFGKTPPCAPIIIEKKFSKVIVATIDPNPVVSGKGIEMLRQNGIDVQLGVLEWESKWINRFFFVNTIENRTFVLMKIAQSINGAIATSNLESKWITSIDSRTFGHRLRGEVDAVLVGRNTTRRDDPSLSLHNEEGKIPYRVILDSNLSLPLDLKVFVDQIRKYTILVVSEGLQPSRKRENLELAGVKILEVPTIDGLIDIKSMLFLLREKFNINSLLVEGGAQVFSSFLKENLWDELDFFIAPRIIPGGLNSFSSFKVAGLNEAVDINFKFVERSGSDLYLIATNPHLDEILGYQASL